MCTFWIKSREEFFFLDEKKIMQFHGLKRKILRYHICILNRQKTNKFCNLEQFVKRKCKKKDIKIFNIL